MKQRRLMNQINVVPYIDVMLVLLVIFMVTAPLITTSTIDVPSVGPGPAPPSEPLEVIIKADSSLALRDLARGGEERTVSRAELSRAIKEMQARNKQQPVLIAADKSVRYEAVVNVMDELKKNQVQRVSLLVQIGK